MDKELKENILGRLDDIDSYADDADDDIASDIYWATNDIRQLLEED